MEPHRDVLPSADLASAALTALTTSAAYEGTERDLSSSSSPPPLIHQFIMLTAQKALKRDKIFFLVYD